MNVMMMRSSSPSASNTGYPVHCTQARSDAAERLKPTVRLENASPVRSTRLTGYSSSGMTEPSSRTNLH
jgi:hypothetical protein